MGPAPDFLCLDSGTVPQALTITVETGCGIFTGTLSRGGDNCWIGNVTLRCISIDPLHPEVVACFGPFDTCWMLCCASAAQTTPEWLLWAGCNGFIKIAVSETNSCSPFYVTFAPFYSANASIQCLNDTFMVTITE